MKRFFKAILILILPVVAVSLFFWTQLNIPTTPQKTELSIEKGMSLRQVSRRLEEQGIVKNHLIFLVYARLLGESKNIKAGEYLFAVPRTSREVLTSLVNGDVLAYKIQIIEGWNLRQIAAYLETLPFLNDAHHFAERFLSLAQDQNFIAGLGLQTRSLEGYLFPNTYFFTKKTPAEEYLTAFVNEFKKRYAVILQKYRPTVSLSEHELLTMASIIEKETGQRGERDVVASVFYNRLKKGMLLQSDPTTIYGIKNFDGNIRKSDLKNQHPYNTYIHNGLPPGPICNPGEQSLKAAMQPAHTDYLFFVSQNNGTHFFSRTMAEHAEAVRVFQLERRTSLHPENQQTQQTQ